MAAITHITFLCNRNLNQLNKNISNYYNTAGNNREPRALIVATKIEFVHVLAINFKRMVSNI